MVYVVLFVASFVVSVVAIFAEFARVSLPVVPVAMLYAVRKTYVVMEVIILAAALTDKVLREYRGVIVGLAAWNDRQALLAV
jgi:hypothetical protein